MWSWRKRFRFRSRLCYSLWVACLNLSLFQLALQKELVWSNTLSNLRHWTAPRSISIEYLQSYYYCSGYLIPIVNDWRSITIVRPYLIWLVNSVQLFDRLQTDVFACCQLTVIQSYKLYRHNICCPSVLVTITFTV